MWGCLHVSPRALAGVVLVVYAVLWGAEAKFYSPIVRVDVLFVLYDADESASLTPVFDELRESAASFAVVTVAPGAEGQLLKKYPANCMSLVTDLCAAGFDPDGSAWQELHTSEIEKVAGRFGFDDPESCPTAIIVGASSMIQRQILYRFDVRKSPKNQNAVAFLNAFRYDPKDTGAVFRQFLNASLVDRVWVAAEDLRTAILPQLGPHVEIDVVGNPSCTIWKDALLTADRQYILNRLYDSVLPPSFHGLPILMYAGGSGRGYEECLKAYLLSIWSLGLTSTYANLIVPSLGADGQQEAEVISDLHLGSSVFVDSSGISALNVSLVSSLVTTQHSLPGVQSLFVGVPSLFYQAPPFRDSNSTVNVPVLEGLSPMVWYTSQFSTAFIGYQNSTTPFFFNSSRLESAGIPLDGLQLLLDRLGEVSQHEYDRKEAESAVLLNKDHCYPGQGEGSSPKNAFWWFAVVGLPALFIVYVCTVPCLSVAVYVRSKIKKARAADKSEGSGGEFEPLVEPVDVEPLPET